MALGIHYVNEIEFPGRVFVLTGKLENFTRAQASEVIRGRGGMVVNKVDSTTDYLITGDRPGSVKFNSGQLYKVAYVHETTFIAALQKTYAVYQPKAKAPVKATPYVKKFVEDRNKERAMETVDPEMIVIPKKRRITL